MFTFSLLMQHDSAKVHQVVFLRGKKLVFPSRVSGSRLNWSILVTCSVQNSGVGADFQGDGETPQPVRWQMPSLSPCCSFKMRGVWMPKTSSLLQFKSSICMQCVWLHRSVPPNGSSSCPAHLSPVMSQDITATNSLTAVFFSKNLPIVFRDGEGKGDKSH